MIQKKALWDRVGHLLASIAHGIAKAALWASQHPDVMQTLSQVAVGAGASASVAAKVNAGIAAVGTIAAKRGPQ